LSGKDTQKAFDTVVRSLAKNAPPVPGFRKAKGGKLLYDFILFKSRCGHFIFLSGMSRFCHFHISRLLANNFQPCHIWVVTASLSSEGRIGNVMGLNLCRVCV
jgi:hypothetical protein